MNRIICLNPDPVPAATRFTFFHEEGTDNVGVAARGTGLPRPLDPRRSAYITFDKITVPVDGDGRILCGPGDMFVAARACRLAGVNVIVSPTAVDVYNALELLS